MSFHEKNNEANKVLKIEKYRPYYANFGMTVSRFDPQTRESIFDENGMKMKLVNEDPRIANMDRDKWYLLPQAYSLTLTKINP